MPSYLTTQQQHPGQEVQVWGREVTGIKLNLSNVSKVMICHSRDQWASYPSPQGKELVSFQGQINHFLLKRFSFDQVLKWQKSRLLNSLLPFTGVLEVMCSHFLRFSFFLTMRTWGLENDAFLTIESFLKKTMYCWTDPSSHSTPFTNSNKRTNKNTH
jgi:hypothetical protein